MPRRNLNNLSAGASPEVCGKLVDASAFPLYRSDSDRVLRSVLKSPSRCRRDSIFLMEWMTVEWCLPPKLFPISGSDAFVNALHRYIAIWRGMAIDFELFRDFNSVNFSW